MKTYSKKRTPDTTIVINATNLGQPFDGIGVYVLNILRELAKHCLHHTFLVYVNASAAVLLKDISFPPNFTLRIVSARLSPERGLRGHLRRFLYAQYLSFIHRNRIVLSASPMESMIYHTKQIIMVHDVIPYFFRWCNKRQYYLYKYLLPSILSRALSVITPSQHTRGLLVHLYGIPEENIRVIHNGVQSEFLTSSLQGSVPKKNYILFAGRTVPMKNLAGLLRAFSLIQDLVPHTLVIAGSNRRESPVESETDWLRKYNIRRDRVVFRGCIPTREISQLVHEASLLVFPSFYEGFGFPPLEAMAGGCPVVASGVASVPEVCGDAAYYVDPYVDASIAEGIRNVLLDNSLRETMIARGLERASRFSWETSGRKHVEVFDDAVRLLSTRRASAEGHGVPEPRPIPNLVAAGPMQPAGASAGHQQ